MPSTRSNRQFVSPAASGDGQGVPDRAERQQGKEAAQH